MIGYYFLVNFLFAFLYLAGGDSIAGATPGSLRDAFFFSVQTICTIGYGIYAPKTLYAHSLVAVESLMGLLSFATMTGIAFSKLSRPSARVLFSKVAVITQRDGVQSLMFRAANERASHIAEATMRLVFVRSDVTKEGEKLRRMLDLKLTRNSTSVFLFSWTVIHQIDETSPLYGLTNTDLEKLDALFVVSFLGIEPISGQTVHRQYTYLPEDIKWNAKFKDILSLNEEGLEYVDLTHFHEFQNV